LSVPISSGSVGEGSIGAVVIVIAIIAVVSGWIVVVAAGCGRFVIIVDGIFSGRSRLLVVLIVIRILRIIIGILVGVLGIIVGPSVGVTVSVGITIAVAIRITITIIRISQAKADPETKSPAAVVSTAIIATIVSATTAIITMSTIISMTAVVPAACRAYITGCAISVDGAGGRTINSPDAITCRDTAAYAGASHPTASNAGAVPITSYTASISATSHAATTKS
jgi:hypothetical protein